MPSWLPWAWSLRARLRLWEAALSSWGWYNPPAMAGVEADPRAVRQAMQEIAEELRAARLKLKILRAPDLRALWYLRGSLMQAIATERGELQARRLVAQVDALFTEAWPAAPVSRPAPLE